MNCNAAHVPPQHANVLNIKYYLVRLIISYGLLFGLVLLLKPMVVCKNFSYVGII